MTRKVPPEPVSLEHDELRLTCHRHPNVTVDVIPVEIVSGPDGSWVDDKAKELGIPTPEFVRPVVVFPAASDTFGGRSMEEVVDGEPAPSWWRKRTIAEDEAFRSSGGQARIRRTWTCPACVLESGAGPITKVDLTQDTFLKVLTVLIGAGLSRDGSGVSNVPLKMLNDVAFRLSL